MKCCLLVCAATAAEVLMRPKQLSLPACAGRPMLTFAVAAGASVVLIHECVLPLPFIYTTAAKIQTSNFVIFEDL